MSDFEGLAGPPASRPRASRNVTSLRQASLDRDVFYFDDDRREEVVTYKPFVLGSSVRKFGMTADEEAVYKSSLANLCSQLAKVSRDRFYKIPFRPKIFRTNFYFSWTDNLFISIGYNLRLKLV
jgi:hypothetical protein